jgi:hypothetical protein
MLLFSCRICSSLPEVVYVGGPHNKSMTKLPHHEGSNILLVSSLQKAKDSLCIALASSKHIGLCPHRSLA